MFRNLQQCDMALLIISALRRKLMKSIIFALACCTVIVQQAQGQWKKLADFVDSSTGEGQQIDCIYFLDKPGLPSMGYTSAGPLYKTMDGGKTWNKCITGSGLFKDIYFADSLTGWAVGYNNPVRTTDGGNTWQKLYPPVVAKAPNGNYYYPTGFSVYYSSFSKKLFLGLVDSVMLVSSDSGDTWQRTNILSVAGLAFSTPQDGILVTNQVLDDSHHPFRWVDSLSHVYVTSNGGDSWRLGNQPFSWQYTVQQPLAISDSFIYFQICGIQYNDTLGEAMAVFRSDDSGMTWNKIYTFPALVRPPPVIRGDLHNLYVQTGDSGCYRSTDEGVTWSKTNGPSWGCDRFYSKNGLTIASSAFTKNGMGPYFDGLWERIDPMLSVAPQAANDRAAVYPNPAHDRITLHVEAPASYEVLNVLGAVWLRGKSEETSLTLDISQLPAGVYYARLLATTGETRTVKIVKE
jgi:photosystem II stability/assembly factor-like uncharacterized protein